MSGNIILIGMPGAGKSTVGVLLAKQTSRDFVDTDVLIQTRHGCRLQDILDADGYLALRQVEEDVLLDLDVHHCVIATGGSAVYSDVGMRSLRRGGILVFLDASLETIRCRVCDFDNRGIAKRPDQSISDLFQERGELYRRYAEYTVACNGRGMEEIVGTIITEIGEASK